MNKTRRKITPEDLQASRQLKEIWLRKKSELGLSQEAAAEALGMSQSGFNQYLNGKAALNFEAAAKFAALLHVHVGNIRSDYGTLVDRAAGGTHIDRIIDELPLDAQQSQLSFLKYNIERAEGFLATEKIISYAKFIEELQQDMAKRKKDDDQNNASSPDS